MLYKHDFEDIVPRMEAWWKGEITDRACIAVHAPKDVSPREIPAPGDLRRKWTDTDYIIESAEAHMEATYFGGDSVPVLRPNLGPDFFSALMGGVTEYRESTSWVAPFLDWDNPVSFKLDMDSFEWKWHIEFYKKAQERSRDRYFLAAPDCHSGGDALLSMRGGTDICLDLYDRPDAVHAAMVKLEEGVARFYGGFWEYMEANGQKGHVCSWLNTWSPGRSGVAQLDLLALISPDMFRDFFYHELEVQCGFLDNIIFHLDGPDAIKHLPLLYELPGNVAAVQWVYGAGNGPMVKWIPLLTEIQSNGRGLHLSCVPDEVEILMKELSSKGLYLSTWADSPEEADDLVKLVERLTHD